MHSAVTILPIERNKWSHPFRPDLASLLHASSAEEDGPLGVYQLHAEGLLDQPGSASDIIAHAKQHICFPVPKSILRSDKSSLAHTKKGTDKEKAKTDVLYKLACIFSIVAHDPQLHGILEDKRPKVVMCLQMIRHANLSLDHPDSYVFHLWINTNYDLCARLNSFFPGQVLAGAHGVPGGLDPATESDSFDGFELEGQDNSEAEGKKSKKNEKKKGPREEFIRMVHKQCQNPVHGMARTHFPMVSLVTPALLVKVADYNMRYVETSAARPSEAFRRDGAFLPQSSTNPANFMSLECARMQTTENCRWQLSEELLHPLKELAPLVRELPFETQAKFLQLLETARKTRRAFLLVQRFTHNSDDDQQEEGSEDELGAGPGRRRSGEEDFFVAQAREDEKKGLEDLRSFFELTIPDRVSAMTEREWELLFEVALVPSGQEQERVWIIPQDSAYLFFQNIGMETVEWAGLLRLYLPPSIKGLKPTEEGKEEEEKNAERCEEGAAGFSFSKWAPLGPDSTDADARLGRDLKRAFGLNRKRKEEALDRLFAQYEEKKINKSQCLEEKKRIEQEFMYANLKVGVDFESRLDQQISATANCSPGLQAHMTFLEQAAEDNDGSLYFYQAPLFADLNMVDQYVVFMHLLCNALGMSTNFEPMLNVLFTIDGLGWPGVTNCLHAGLSSEAGVGKDFMTGHVLPQLLAEGTYTYINASSTKFYFAQQSGETAASQEGRNFDDQVLIETEAQEGKLRGDQKGSSKNLNFLPTCGGPQLNLVKSFLTEGRVASESSYEDPTTGMRIAKRVVSKGKACSIINTNLERWYVDGPLETRYNWNTFVRRKRPGRQPMQIDVVQKGKMAEKMSHLAKVMHSLNVVVGNLQRLGFLPCMDDSYLRTMISRCIEELGSKGHSRATGGVRNKKYCQKLATCLCQKALVFWLCTSPASPWRSDLVNGTTGRRSKEGKFFSLSALGVLRPYMVATSLSAAAYAVNHVLSEYLYSEQRKAVLQALLAKSCVDPQKQKQSMGQAQAFNFNSEHGETSSALNFNRIINLNSRESSSSSSSSSSQNPPAASAFRPFSPSCSSSSSSGSLQPVSGTLNTGQNWNFLAEIPRWGEDALLPEEMLVGKFNLSLREAADPSFVAPRRGEMRIERERLEAQEHSRKRHLLGFLTANNYLDGKGNVWLRDGLGMVFQTTEKKQALSKTAAILRPSLSKTIAQEGGVEFVLTMLKSKKPDLDVRVTEDGSIQMPVLREDGNSELVLAADPVLLNHWCWKMKLSSVLAVERFVGLRTLLSIARSTRVRPQKILTGRLCCDSCYQQGVVVLWPDGQHLGLRTQEELAVDPNEEDFARMVGSTEWEEGTPAAPAPSGERHKKRRRLAGKSAQADARGKDEATEDEEAKREFDDESLEHHDAFLRKLGYSPENMPQQTDYYSLALRSLSAYEEDRESSQQAAGVAVTQNILKSFYTPRCRQQSPAQ